MITQWATPTDSLHQYWDLFHSPDGLLEVRIMRDVGRKKDEIGVGRFTDRDVFVSEIIRLVPDSRIRAFYVALNPVSPNAPWAHPLNRIVRSYKSAGDEHIVRRQWLLIDIDPDRPTGTNSTEGEHKQSLVVSRDVYLYLQDQGWPKPIVADSGNGTHLLYRIDMSADEESTRLIKAVLSALNTRFYKADPKTGIKCKVDQTVANPSRISKLYGTPTRKGENTEERPQRSARWIIIPDTVDIVTIDQIHGVGAMAPIERRSMGGVVRGSQVGKLPDWMLSDAGFEQWLADHGVTWRKVSTYNSATRWHLDVCPWNGHTDQSAIILRYPDGRLAANCSHNSCEGKGWAEFRAVIDPGYLTRRLQYENRMQRLPEGWGTEEFTLAKSLVLDLFKARDVSRQDALRDLLLHTFEGFAWRASASSIEAFMQYVPRDLHPELRDLWAHARKSLTLSSNIS